MEIKKKKKPKPEKYGKNPTSFYTSKSFLIQYYAAKMLIEITECFFELFIALEKILISSLLMKSEL